MEDGRLTDTFQSWLWSLNSPKITGQFRLGFVDDKEIEEDGEDDHIQIVRGDSQNNASLEIDELVYEDRANYTCQAANDFASVSISTLVRVKGEHCSKNE